MNKWIKIIGLCAAVGLIASVISIGSTLSAHGATSTNKTTKKSTKTTKKSTKTTKKSTAKATAKATSASSSTSSSGGSTSTGNAIGYGSSATGGAGGSSVTVTSASALVSAVSGTDAKTVIISGNIDTSGLSTVGVDVGSNKTIIGANSSAAVTGIGFRLKKSTNVIIKNLTLNFTKKGSETHGVEIIEGTSKVWVDHCNISSHYTITAANSSKKDEVDGAIDIKKGALAITVSWCHFQNNWKNMLIGFSDSDSASSSTQITLHHNWFDTCSSRMPSVRYATAHIYNNLYTTGLTTGINSRMGAKLYIENNYFDTMTDPIGFWDSDSTGYWNVSGNTFVNCTGSQPTTSTTSYKPTYSYSVDATANVPSIVKAGVGPK